MSKVNRKRCWIGFSLCSICAAFSASAADREPIATDRPDFVESSEVVGPGTVQIEAGLSLDRDAVDDGDVRTITTPTLVRVGVSETLELRLETDGRTSVRESVSQNDQTTNGFSDIALGVKWRARQSDGVGSGPGIALLIHADIDSGSEEFKGEGIRPSVRMVAEWELPGDMAIGVMPGLVYDNVNGERFINGIMAATMSVPLATQWRGFVELAAASIASEEHGGNVVTFDAGVTYLVSNDVQLDVAMARGLTSNTPEWNVGVGLSIRF
jgi:hypothetical protein